MVGPQGLAPLGVQWDSIRVKVVTNRVEVEVSVVTSLSLRNLPPRSPRASDDHLPRPPIDGVTSSSSWISLRRFLPDRARQNGDHSDH